MHQTHYTMIVSLFVPETMETARKGRGQRTKTLKEIHELMELKGWTQAELARQLELTEGAVSRWFKGENSPTGPARILLRLWLDQARKRKMASAGR